MNDQSVNAQPSVRSLHFRAAIVNSILSGIGIAGAVALLSLIALSVNFSGRPTNEQEVIGSIALVSAVYALGGALIVAALSFLSHGLVLLLARKPDSVHVGVSHAYSAIAGGLVGAGFMVWQIILVPQIGLLTLVIFAAAILATIYLTAGVSIGLSALLGINKTDDGKKLSHSLARTAGIFTLAPWLYMVLLIITGR